MLSARFAAAAALTRLSFCPGENALKAVREDRLESDTGSGGFPVRHVLLVLAILAVG
jgi:hypothetical protein